MAKMYIMVGLPASGKTTAAQEILKADGNAVRINKDLLRTMLHFDKFTGKNEGLTQDAARHLAKFFLEKNKNVVIDDTNLNPRTMQSWKDLAKEMDAKVEVNDMTDVSVIECVVRDGRREKSVGNMVIKNMALRYGLSPTPNIERGYVLCDIDGTIADPTHRLHYVKVADGEQKNWKGFFSEMDKDPVRPDTRKMLIDYYNKGYIIIFLTARPENYRDVTLKWIDDNMLSFAWTVIFARGAHDKRPDVDVKREALERYFPNKKEIHAVIDDRPSVIRMWQESGLNVIDVGHGVEF